jgi:hypothetical protein
MAHAGELSLPHGTAFRLGSLKARSAVKALCLAVLPGRDRLSGRLLYAQVDLAQRRYGDGAVPDDKAAAPMMMKEYLSVGIALERT